MRNTDAEPPNVVIVQHKNERSYGLVRLVCSNGTMLVKRIADDTPSRFYAADDFAPASEADVPWFKAKSFRHACGNILLYWKLPSGRMVCEDESGSTWFEGEYVFSSRLSQLGPDAA
jgi:hypothetical protein